MNANVVCFAHGKESGPWGTKITALADVARGRGFSVESPDYSSTHNPEERVQQLLALNLRARGALVLVGSSMGGYVSTVASGRLKPRGLFLLAPAFYIREYAHQNPQPHAAHVSIVHGWSDEIIPVEHSIRFAKEYKARLHIVAGDHRLTSALPVIEKLFALFLEEVVHAV